ncbi:MAG: hypothetical protein CME70_01020 [Halobacteriovorax sp.]|nr:hypothetical protein [Halobacteriovorax sp.]|tara:strand:+ start:99891 stop:100601 length:711 start_codon:yes stop_codon:yes gene_type:complete
MKLYLTLFLALISFQSLGEELNRCFYDHVKDAIELNRERRGAYSKETNGASEKISRYLIIWEKLILLKANKYDRKSSQFQNLGIPFMCEDFIDMRETPEIITRTAQIPRGYLNIYKPKTKIIKKNLKASLKIGYKPFKISIVRELEKLKFNKSYDCLLRHLLESLLRTADLAPRYIAVAPQGKKQELDKLIKKYLRLQIFGISQAVFIDKKARSLQAEGVPILCNDVPHVPLSDWK